MYNTYNQHCNINQENYNHLKELSLDVLENNIDGLCEINPFDEPNLNGLDNQINDFIENFFENNDNESLGDNEINKCNKPKNIVSSNNYNDDKPKENGLNNLLDHLNELELLLHNSKSELINKMNKLKAQGNHMN